MYTASSIINHCLSPFTDPNSKRSSHGESLRALDGLRGLAVLVVIASHTAAFGMYAQGSLGVLMFFFLSGFVLTTPYALDPSRLFRDNQLFRFAANRFLRIVPIYLVAVIIIAWLLDANFNWVIAHMIFYKGWNHLWSVAEEARFYLLFPVVIAGLWLISRHSLKICALVLLIYFAYQFKDLHKIDMLDGRFVSFYFWMFLGGMLTCLLYRWPVLSLVTSLEFVKSVLAGCALLVLMMLFFSSDYMISAFWRPIFPGLPTDFKLNGWKIPAIWFFLFLVLIYSVTTNQTSIASRFLQSYFLRHIGLLSYSLYLFHMPIYLHLTPLGFHHEGLFFATLLLSYSAAIFSYVLIEKPFLLLKPKRK